MFNIFLNGTQYWNCVVLYCVNVFSSPMFLSIIIEWKIESRYYMSLSCQLLNLECFGTLLNCEHCEQLYDIIKIL